MATPGSNLPKLPPKWPPKVPPPPKFPPPKWPPKLPPKWPKLPGLGPKGRSGRVGWKPSPNVTSRSRNGHRVVELSRMLSGQPDSATARGHAEELLASARERQP